MLTQLSVAHSKEYDKMENLNLLLNNSHLFLLYNVKNKSNSKNVHHQKTRLSRPQHACCDVNFPPMGGRREQDRPLVGFVGGQLTVSSSYCVFTVR